MANKKETALDLAKFIDKGVRVKLAGGREGAYTVGIGADALRAITPCQRYASTTVTGVLKGYDQLLNLVLDETLEFLRGAH